MEGGYAKRNELEAIEGLQFIPVTGTHLISLAVKEEVCISDCFFFLNAIQ